MNATKGYLFERLVKVRAYSVELRNRANQALKAYDDARAHWCSRCGEEPPGVIRVDGGLQDAIEALRKVVQSG